MSATVRIRDDIRYGYAVGRVRVLDGRLLSRTTFERLLDAPDLREQKRILAETHVGRYLEGAETAGEVERALDASLADLYDEFLLHADLPAAVVAYFRLPYDYANLRAALKARVLGIAAGELSALGSAPPEAFASDGSGLPEEMRELLVRWDDAVAKGTNLLPEKLSWDAAPPVQPDAKGSYRSAVAVPGEYKAY